MAQRTKENLRGFLVPFPFTKDDVIEGFANTTFTMFSPIADIPTSSDNTKLLTNNFKMNRKS